MFTVVRKVCSCAARGRRQASSNTLRRIAVCVTLRARVQFVCGACSVFPRSRSRTWGTTSTIAFSDSTAPRGEPGRLTINTLPRVPATARESAASGVAARPARRMTSARPGISRSMTARVASGVTSRAAMPVPPVVKMAETSLPSASVARRREMNSASSEITSMAATVQPNWPSRSATAGPETSWRAPACTESLIVRTAARIMISSVPGGGENRCSCRPISLPAEGPESRSTCRGPWSCRRWSAPPRPHP